MSLREKGVSVQSLVTIKAMWQMTFPYFSYLFFPKENKKKPHNVGGKVPIALECKIWIGTRCGKKIRQHFSVNQQ